MPVSEHADDPTARALRLAREEWTRPYIEALQQIFDYAYGASGVTGDDAGHLTHVGMIAKKALRHAG